MIVVLERFSYWRMLCYCIVGLSSSADITKNENKQNYEGQVTASRKRLDHLAAKRERDEDNEIESMWVQYFLSDEYDLFDFTRSPLPIINLNKRQKNSVTNNTDPMLTSIADSIVVLPDNWHSLNTKKSAPNISKSKRQQQEKGSNYNDRIKSKIAASKVKNQRRSKQKNS